VSHLVDRSFKEAFTKDILLIVLSLNSALFFIYGVLKAWEVFYVPFEIEGVFKVLLRNSRVERPKLHLACRQKASWWRILVLTTACHESAEVNAISLFEEVFRELLFVTAFDVGCAYSIQFSKVFKRLRNRLFIAISVHWSNFRIVKGTLESFLLSLTA